MTAIAVFAMAIMMPVALVTGYYAEQWLPGGYITFSDIAWTTAAVVTVKGMFPLGRLTRGWPPRIACLLALAGAAAIIAWGLSVPFGDALMSFTKKSATPVAVAAIAALVVCQSIAYFVATTDNPLTRLLDGAARRQPRAHGAKATR